MSITEQRACQTEERQAGREGFRAERKRDVKECGHKWPDPRLHASPGNGAFPATPTTTSAPGKGTWPLPPLQRGQAGMASGAQGRSPPAPGTPALSARKARWGRENGQDKTLPAHPKAEPHPLHPSAPAAPGRSPAPSTQAPRFQAPGGLGRDAGASGSEQGREAGRVPTPVSPAGALPPRAPLLGSAVPGLQARRPRLR